MEKWNPENVEKIWQRVQSAHTPPSASPDLCGCIDREMHAAAIYNYLARKTAGKAGEQLRSFARQSQSHAAAIKGICALTGQNCPPTRPVPTQSAPTHILLRRCYGLAAQALAEYEAMTARADIGSIFHRLARDKQAQMVFLLQLLGTTKSQR